MTGGPSGTRAGLRAVATLEALKGLVVLLAGFGAFALLHRDAQSLAEQVVLHFHLNPAHHVPRIFLEAARRVTDARLWALSAGALTYAGVRLVEAWGLWRARAWAEWLGALSGSVYVPFEVAALFTRPTAMRAGMLLANLAVVAYLASLLRASRRPAP